MRIGCICATYGRPIELGRLIEAFNRQTYASRFLTIVDDGGQYPDQPHGDRWQVVSGNRRYVSLGVKRNETAKMAYSCDAYACCDDDDILMPWWLDSVAAALRRRHWAQPREILEFTLDGAAYTRHESYARSDPTRPAYGAAMAFRRDAFWSVGGYPESGPDDTELAEKLLAKYGPSADSTKDFAPWFVHCRHEGQISKVMQRLHDEGRPQATLLDEAYAAKAGERFETVDIYPLIRWPVDYAAIPIPPKEETRPRPW